MNNIKKYDDFLNEELNNSTYISASKKLRRKGHVNRSEKIKKHVYDSIHKSFNDVINIDDVEYNVTEYNISTEYGKVKLTFDEKNDIFILFKWGYDDEEGGDGEFYWLFSNNNIKNIDRKNAIKIFKVFKQTFEELSITTDSLYGEIIPLISVNDFYRD